MLVLGHLLILGMGLGLILASSFYINNVEHKDELQIVWARLQDTAPSQITHSIFQCGAAWNKPKPKLKPSQIDNGTLISPERLYNCLLFTQLQIKIPASH